MSYDKHNMAGQLVMTRYDRRKFLSTSLKGVAGTFALCHLPAIVPASVIGKNSPSNRINVGVIGTGRIARQWDMPGILKYDSARIIAVCDLDRSRIQKGKEFVDGHYSKVTGKSYNGTTGYRDYEDLLANKDIDAVLICTPDHWHALVAINAARAGKHIYLEKPATLTIRGGRLLSDEVHKANIVSQVGSQLRSISPWPQYHKVCELVRNGRIGDIHTIYVGLPGDDPKLSKPQHEMPIPENLNYEKWLGSTPYTAYTEHKVHPQRSFSRPGWMRCRQFGSGMITGWGAHHFGIASWGMGTSYTGPVEVSCQSVVWPSTGGLWDVHGPFKTTSKFANGVTVYASDSYDTGIKFVGTEGWIFVGRGHFPTKASDPRILKSEIGPGEVHLYKSSDHHGNWLECIRSGKPTVEPIEIGHRDCSVCLLNAIAMVLKRKLYWNPDKECFVDDDHANAMLSRSQRWPYQFLPEFDVITNF